HHTDPALFKRFLDDNGLPLDAVRRHFERNFLARECVRAMVATQVNKVGLPQVLAYYRSHPEEFTVEDSVRWLDLFISFTGHPSQPQGRTGAPAYLGAVPGITPAPGTLSRAAACRLAAGLLVRLQSGDNFLHLARSFDDGDRCLHHAEGVGQRRGEIWPPAAEAAPVRARPGEVCRVETNDGIHLVKLLSRQHAGQKPFDRKVQKQIHQKLCNEVFERELKRILAELRRQSVIEYAHGYQASGRALAPRGA